MAASARRSLTSRESLDENIQATRFILDVFVDRLQADREQALSITADVETQIKEQEAKLIKHVARLLFLREHLANSSDPQSTVAAGHRKTSAYSTDVVGITTDNNIQIPVHVLSTSTFGSLTAQSHDDSNNKDVHAVDDLRKFVKMLNVSEDAVQHCVDHVGELSAILGADDRQIAAWFDTNRITNEHRRRLTTAFTNLKNYTNRWMQTQVEPDDHEFGVNDLCWHSYDRLVGAAEPTNLDSSSATAPNTSNSSAPSTSTAPTTAPSNTQPLTARFRQKFLHEERTPVVVNNPQGAAPAVDRRSISESGADSGASDSGVGSNVSQTSLPTTTPPASPGFLSMVGSRVTGALLAGLNNQMTGSDSPDASGPSISRMSSSRGSMKRSKTPPTHLKWVTNPNAAKGNTSSRGRSGGNQQVLSPKSTPSRAISTGSGTITSTTNTSMLRSRSAESNVSHRVQPNPTCDVNLIASSANISPITGVSAGNLLQANANPACKLLPISRSEHMLLSSSVADSPAAAIPQARGTLTSSSSTDAIPPSSPAHHAASQHHSSVFTNLSSPSVDSARSGNTLASSNLLSPTSPYPPSGGAAGGTSPNTAGRFFDNKVKMPSGTVSRYVERRRDLLQGHQQHVPVQHQPQQLLAHQIRRSVSHNEHLSNELHQKQQQWQYHIDSSPLSAMEPVSTNSQCIVTTPTSPKVFLQHENGDNELLFDAYDVGQQHGGAQHSDADTLSSGVDSPQPSHRSLPRSVSDYTTYVPDRPPIINHFPSVTSAPSVPRTRIYHSRIPKSETTGLLSTAMHRQQSFRLSRNCRSESLGDQKAVISGDGDSPLAGDLTKMKSVSKPELKKSSGMSTSGSFDNGNGGHSLLSPTGIKNALFASGSALRFGAGGGSKRAPPPSRLTLNLAPGGNGGSSSAYSSGFSSPQHDTAFGMFGGTQAAPKSPRTGRILHEIPHAWERCRGSMTKHCYVCRKVLGLFGEREKCQRCKVRIHTSCKSDMPPNACGLTKDHVLYMYSMYMMQDEGGWSGAPSTPAPTGDNMSNSAGIGNSRSMPRIDELNPTDSASMATVQQTLFQYPYTGIDIVDSSSSTNSSAPSTPAPYNRAMTAPPHSAASIYSSRSTGSGAHNEQKFVFPVSELPDVPTITEPTNEDLISSVRSGDSDMTVRVNSMDSHALTGSAGGSSMDECGLVGRTASIDSTCHVSSPSTSSHNENSTPPRNGSGSQPLSPFSPGVRSRAHWSRVAGTVRGPSTSWRDVTIPFSEIQFSSDSLIGLGRFGPVHRGYWHQDVAVKLLNMDHVDDDTQMLNTFKQEVDSFRNTRHDNIVLFLGYCLDPPKLAIVMNFCKGRTLYTIIHRNRERMDFQKAVSIAKHITQGMSYLHQRQILHKDVRTKNIFVEPNNKIMITDFGLFSMKRLKTPMMLMEQAQDAHVLPSADTDLATVYQQGSYVQVPEHWLCYLAPELARAIPSQFDTDLPELPFSYSSDVYAFGTVWYELLTGDFPFAKFPPDSILWQIGRGIKPSLNNLQAPKEIKDILARCWSYGIDERPKFDELFQMMDKMPKKKLARSPSHPIQLSRSVESVF